MPTEYEYWEHRASREVWAVKLDNRRVVGAVKITPYGVDPAALERLPYQAADAAAIEKRRQDFTRIQGRRVT